MNKAAGLTAVNRKTLKCVGLYTEKRLLWPAENILFSFSLLSYQHSVPATGHIGFSVPRLLSDKQLSSFLCSSLLSLHFVASSLSQSWRRLTDSQYPQFWHSFHYYLLSQRALCSGRRKEDFNIGQFNSSSMCPSSMETVWMLQVSPECVMNLSPTLAVTGLFSSRSLLVAKQGVESCCVALVDLFNLLTPETVQANIWLPKRTNTFISKHSDSCAEASMSYLLCTEQSSTKPPGSGLFQEFALRFSDQLDGNVLKVLHRRMCSASAESHIYTLLSWYDFLKSQMVSSMNGTCSDTMMPPDVKVFLCTLSQLRVNLIKANGQTTFVSRSGFLYRRHCWGTRVNIIL